jgi:dCMP deaminase
MTDRPSRDSILMGTAKLFAQRSTCDRAHVGAVFSRDGRILVTGYNGAPTGMPHCIHEYTNIYEGGSTAPIAIRFTDPADIAACQAVHAEQNAIAWAARKGVRLEGCEVHVTLATCIVCARSLINAGVVRVVYDQTYRDMSGIDLLEAAGVQIGHWGA